MNAANQSNIKRKTSRPAGVTAVEFALVAPIVFILIFGIFELTRVTMVRQALTNAAREGCRAATLATTRSASTAESKVRTRLNGVIPGHLDTSIVQVKIDPTDLSKVESMTPITTTVLVRYGDISLLPGWLLGNSEVSVSVTMERE